MDNKNIKSAIKRARHFSQPFDGPFTATGNSGASIPARNYAYLIDSGFRTLSKRRPDRTRLKNLTIDLCLFDSWAQSINRHCDAYKVADDEGARWAFSSFLSRIWYQPG